MNFTKVYCRAYSPYDVEGLEWFRQIAWAFIFLLLTPQVLSNEAIAPHFALSSNKLEEIKYQKLETWDDVYERLQLIDTLPPETAEALIKDLIVNLRVRTIKKGQYLSDADKEMERIRTSCIRLLERNEIMENISLMRQLILAMPNITREVEEVRLLWSAVQELDERYLDNGISHEIREAIHGHMSQRDLLTIRAYLEFIEKGSTRKLEALRLSQKLDVKDRSLRNEFLESGGDESKMGQQVVATLSLLREIESLLSFVFEIMPKDVKTYTLQMESFATPLAGARYDELRKGLDKVKRAIGKEDHYHLDLTAMNLSSEIYRQILQAPGEDRLNLFYLDQAVRSAAFGALGSFYNTFKENPSKHLMEGTKLINQLAVIVNLDGNGSSSMTEFAEIIQNHALTFSQVYDITKSLSAFYEDAIVYLNDTYREIVRRIASTGEESIMADLARDEIYLNMFGRYVEVLLEYTLANQGLAWNQLIPGMKSKRKVPPILHISPTPQVLLEELDGMRAEYGGKGLTLYKLNLLGIPVPEGFIIPVSLLGKGQQIESRTRFIESIRKAVKVLERDYAQRTGIKGTFGSRENPILVSVRSDPVFSLPGMLDTIINLGMNREIADVMDRKTQDRWYVYDCYRQFLQNFATVVYGLDTRIFHDIIEGKKREVGVRLKEQLDGHTMLEIAFEYKKAIESAGYTIPEDPWEQLITAIEAVYQSWNNPTVRSYRWREKMSKEWKTAVFVQAMIFGNKSNFHTIPIAEIGDVEIQNGHITRENVSSKTNGQRQVRVHKRWLLVEDQNSGEVIASHMIRFALERMNIFNPDKRDKSFDSGTAVVYSRNINTGEKGMSGEYKAQAQGIDIVQLGGIPEKIEELRVKMPSLYSEMASVVFKIDVIRKDIQEIEMTYEEGKNYVLQTRDGGRIQREVPRFQGEQGEILAKGIGASGGAFKGKRVVFIDHGRPIKGEGIVYVMETATPEIMQALDLNPRDAILTVRGGRTSHAAVIARQHQVTAVVGLGDQLILNPQARTAVIGNKWSLKEEDELYLDGQTGNVYMGSKPLMPWKGTRDLAHEIDEIVNTIAKKYETDPTFALFARFFFEIMPEMHKTEFTQEALSQQAMKACRLLEQYIADKAKGRDRIAYAATVSLGDFNEIIIIGNDQPGLQIKIEGKITQVGGTIAANWGNVTAALLPNSQQFVLVYTFQDASTHLALDEAIVESIKAEIEAIGVEGEKAILLGL